MTKLVVLVHGWSVHHTSTYGQLADRLERETRAGRVRDLDVRNIWLSRYVSFDDAVRLPDISRAFNAALRRELGALLDDGRRFACITHSTGGPVVRDWLHRYYAEAGNARQCPMSHLIMLAPANHGSALATLGKSRLGRIKAWFEGVEPGAGVLDWLALGSAESWSLNRASIDYEDLSRGRDPLYQFVLTGQTIDRRLYDFLNSYTGEAGSDGVVRAAAANLNTRYVRLEQHVPAGGNPRHADGFQMTDQRAAPRTAFALISGAAHSGDARGIMRSVRDNDDPHPTVEAIVDCLGVEDARGYDRVVERFAGRNLEVMANERLDVERLAGLPDRRHIIDPHAMLIFRLRDSEGRSLDGYDVLLRAGPNDSPNELPAGFLRDRQRNQRDPGALTLYLNQAVMTGAPAVREGDSVVRDALTGARRLGLSVDPHRTSGLVHNLPCRLRASSEQLARWIRPHATTLVDIVLQRVVREGVFGLTRDRRGASFKRGREGDPVP